MRLTFLLPLFLVTAFPVAAQNDFDLEEAVAVCSSCHGEDGTPVDPEYPVIWGQQYFYVYTQLRDYAAGRRENEIMTPIASEFTREQAKLVAEHFAALTWPALAPLLPMDSCRETLIYPPVRYRLLYSRPHPAPV